MSPAPLVKVEFYPTAFAFLGKGSFHLKTKPDNAWGMERVRATPGKGRPRTTDAQLLTRRETNMTRLLEWMQNTACHEENMPRSGSGSLIDRPNQFTRSTGYQTTRSGDMRSSWSSMQRHMRSSYKEPRPNPNGPQQRPRLEPFIKKIPADLKRGLQRATWCWRPWQGGDTKSGTRKAVTGCKRSRALQKRER